MKLNPCPKDCCCHIIVVQYLSPLIQELVDRENHTSFLQVPIIYAREKEVGGVRLASPVADLVDHEDEKSRQRFKTHIHVYAISQLFLMGFNKETRILKIIGVRICYPTLAVIPTFQLSISIPKPSAIFTLGAQPNSVCAFRISLTYIF
jgi:hypothetical protein